MGMATPLTTTRRAWIEDADCALDAFRTLVSTDTNPADYPLASDVRLGALVYSAETMASTDRHQLQTELIHALSDGPGVVVFEGFNHRARSAFVRRGDRNRESDSKAG